LLIFCIFVAKDDGQRSEDKKVVTEAAYQLLEVMCTSRKFGIIFNVPAFGLLTEKDNWGMKKVLLEIPQPWTNRELRKLVVKILVVCPDLIKTVMKSVTTAMAECKGTPAWVDAVEFVTEVSSNSYLDWYESDYFIVTKMR
jgi:hypothetical protein